ncbi:CCA tRNA nucleotidyltransferase [Euzebya tangerina]|uniref:CCA tRNA nucleotidyltransferase n=1 Tax=Euzebya tangerina TaxID=591198 RepID=UPI00196B4471|nr:CCA tRNA nucleotidyltransferase [Euzebya tangerina]
MASPADSRAEQLQVLGALIDVAVADELGHLFDEAGHELFLVGGIVRDVLMGRASAAVSGDLDFATSATPEQTEGVLRGWADTIWLTGARFGTVSAARGDQTIEITTYRSDAYTAGSRHPEVNFGSSIEADLARRDFTINAIAVRVPDRLVVDPHHGWEAIRAGTLRTPSDAKVSFSDDPLRMLRMARFAAVLGFVPDDEAVAAATAMAADLTAVSAERIQVELDKLMVGEHVGRGLDLLVGTGLAEYIIPEVSALQMERDPAHHHKDVYAHTLAVVESCDADDLILRLAALFHDIGKPATREFHPDGTVSFHHHDVVGARMTRHRMRELKYSKDMIREVSELVRLHLRFHGYSDGEWTDSAVRRYVHDAETTDRLRRLNLLTRADVTTRDKRKRRRFARAMDDLEERIEILAEREAVDAVRPAIDGTQMMAYLGIEPGPLVGKAWNHLKDQALERGPVSEDVAYELLDEWAAGEGLTPVGTRIPPKVKDQKG